MAVVYPPDKLLSALRNSGLVPRDQIDAQVAELPSGTDSAAILRRFVKAGLLTKFQANCFAQGKWRNLVIAGKYKVLDYLGDGGMGQVFLAEHLLMKRQVALKVPPAKKLAAPGMLQRFIREARALAALDHPNIVRAFDLEPFGKLYVLAMEYVDGPSLRELVAEHGPRSPGQAAHYIAQAAQGLQHAHEAGWVHRDIKPDNLLVDPTGVVKVLDLGLAFLLGDDADSPTRKFDENAVLGTADYLAPEQALDSHQVDIRADIYSLGATLYFLLTGRALFECSTVAQKLVAHQVKEPPSVGALRPDVPAGLRRALATMLAKDPADRFQTPAEAARALLPFASDADLAPPPRGGKPVPVRRAGEPSLASTLHARSGSGATRRKVPALGRLVRRLLTHRDWRVKAAAGAGAGAVLLLTGMLSAYVFRGHKVTAAGPHGGPAPAAVVTAVTAGERLVFQAHTGPAESVRLLPDGRIVTGGDDKLVRVWDAAGRQILRQLEGHTQTLRGVSLVPGDSRLVLSTSRDGTVRLWDIDAGVEVRQFLGHTGQVWWADASPDGRRLLTCGTDKTIRLWDLRTGAELRQMTGHTQAVNYALFLPDGRRAVSCGGDKSIRLWDTQTGSELASYTDLPATAYRMTLTPDGRRAVVGSKSTIFVWDFGSGQVARFDAPMEPKAFLEQGRFSPDGRWLLAGGSDGSVRLWDTLTGRELPPLKVGKTKVLEVLWAPDGKSFVVSCADGTVRAWDWPRPGGAGV